MLKCLTPTWHATGLIISYSRIIVGGPDAADAISLTKCHFSLSFEEEEPPPYVPTLNVQCLPTNTWLVHQFIYVKSLVVRDGDFMRAQRREA